jgi:hypothetical protein
MRQKKLGNKMEWIFFLFYLLCFLLSSCNRPNNESEPFYINDDEIKQFPQIKESDRRHYCLTKIEQDLPINILKSDNPNSGYDVRLHMYNSSTSRDVFYVWESGHYVWIGELEIHYSGREYTSLDGTLPEVISITYFIKDTNAGKKGLSITYWGDENRPSEMSCDEAQSYIQKWRASKAESNEN